MLKILKKGNIYKEQRHTCLPLFAILSDIIRMLFNNNPMLINSLFIDLISDKRSNMRRIYRDYIKNPFPIFSIITLHDRITEEIREQRLNYRKAVSKDPTSFELPNITEDIISLFKRDQFEVKILTEEEDFHTAGLILHNCVGSYFQDILYNTKIIVALKEEDKYVALAEVHNNFEIIQCSSHCNKQDEKSKILSEMIENIKLKISDRNANYLFYKKPILPSKDPQ